MKTQHLIYIFAAALCCMSCKQKDETAEYIMEKCHIAVAEGTDMAQLNEQYKANKAEWEAAIEFLSREELDTLSLGRYQLTEKTYANIQEYVPSTPSMKQGRYEAHREYIDIQYALSGEELVYVAALDDARELSSPYSESKDCEFYNLAVASNTLSICPEHLVILFPSEAHMPGRPASEEPDTIRKVVVKIPFYH